MKTEWKITEVEAIRIRSEKVRRIHEDHRLAQVRRRNRQRLENVGAIVTIAVTVAVILAAL